MAKCKYLLAICFSIAVVWRGSVVRTQDLRRQKTRPLQKDSLLRVCENRGSIHTNHTEALLSPRYPVAKLSIFIIFFKILTPILCLLGPRPMSDITYTILSSSCSFLTFPWGWSPHWLRVGRARSNRMPTGGERV